MKLLFLSTEVAPLARVGGLSDVAGALPQALRRLGHDVRVFMPYYPLVTKNAGVPLQAVVNDLPIPTDGHSMTDLGDILRTELPGDVPVYLARHAIHFQDAMNSAAVYPQPLEALLFFVRAAFSWMESELDGWRPDLLHCNDWHTALVPALLAHDDRARSELKGVASLFTVHNLAYQGLFEPAVLDRVGLPWSLYTPEGLEFYGRVNFLKAGLLYADMVNTVSPCYAREIRTPEYGCGLEGVLETLAEQHRLFGILNGIDTSVYDPAADPRLGNPFDADHLDGKGKNRRELQIQCGFSPQSEQPLVGLIGRLVAQKGIDILVPIMDQLVERGMQFVCLGQGDRVYESELLDLQARYPGSVHVTIGFEERLGQQIYGGCDAFLMPSRFEPCGLGQMIALRYGTLPVVRRTGGLADTVIDDDGVSPESNGFVFEGTEPDTLIECLKRMQAVFHHPARWNQLIQHAMRADLSWERSAREYSDLYEAAVSRCRSSPGQ